MSANSRVCVYCANLAGYDDVKAQPRQTIPCDFFYFTDEPDCVVAPPWRVMFADESILPGAPARLRSKYLKVMQHRALERIAREMPDAGSTYDYTIWVDASVRILRDTFAERMLAAAAGFDMAALAHPERDCVFDEFEATLAPATAGRYDIERMYAQVSHYRANGYPTHNGLFASGILVRSARDGAVQRINEAWWEEICRWSAQDQLSLPYVLWRQGLRCGTPALNLWRNPLFEVVPHLGPETGGLLRAARPEYSAGPFCASPNGHSLGTYLAGRGLWRLPAIGGDQTAEFSFGPTDRRMIPIVGDWDGDGMDSPGVYDPETATFFLRNTRSDGDADLTFGFGPAGAIPFAGDWDGAGHDRVGVFIPEHGSWALANRNQPGVADVQFYFGAPGTCMKPVAGDWDGCGRDRVGLYDAAGSSWFLLTENRTGAESRVFDFGPARGYPLVGDWNGDGTDEVGVCVAEQGQAFLAHANRSGSSCARVLVEPPNAWPLAVRQPARS